MQIAGKSFIFDDVLAFSVEEEWDLTGQTLTRGFTANGDHHDSMTVYDPPEDFWYDDAAVWNYVTQWYNSDEKHITFDDDAEDITGAWEQFFILNATEEPDPSTGTYLTEAEDLTAVADAIRLKGGTSVPLTWPDDYVTAVNNIQTGYDVSDGFAKFVCHITTNAEEKTDVNS